MLQGDNEKAKRFLLGAAKQSDHDDASSDEDVSALVQLMRVCFQGDSDVESVVSTLQRRFGDMKVRLLPLLWLY